MVGVDDLLQLVPGPASQDVDCLGANNNLDLCRFGGRLYLAWRTAPSHFASGRARLEVASARDPEGPWRHEATVALGADVREPRLVVDDDRLHLFFMELGTDWKSFQPRRVHRMTTHGSAWDGPVVAMDDAIVPWRIRRLGGTWTLTSYRGAERMYSARPADPVVEVRTSDDLERWSDPRPVHHGGTECEIVELEGGDGLLGVVRNEGPSRAGSDVLVGPELGALAPHPVPQKLDSPNLFLWRGEPWLLARRSLAFSGRYGLAPSRVPGTVSIRVNQLAWWVTRKRSALWRVDAARATVEHVIDLPSRGDTSFAAVVQEPDGALLVADYTSPVEVGDVAWCRAQRRPTVIRLLRLRRSAGAVHSRGGGRP